MARGSLRPGPFGAFASAGPPLQTPAQIFGASLLQLVEADSAADFTLAGALVSTWKDKSGNVLDYTAAGAARPTWVAPPTDGPGPGLGYVRYDGVANVNTSNLNLPVPGVTATLGWGVVRFNRWRDLDRFVSSNVSNGVQNIYQHPSTPSSVAMFNGGATESNTSFGTMGVGTWGLLVWNVTNSDDDFLLCRNSRATGNKSGNSSNNGRRIGSDVTGARFGQIDVYAVGYASGNYISSIDWKVQQLLRYYRSKLTAGVAPPTSTPKGRIIFLGDSLSNPQSPNGLTADVQFSIGTDYWVRDYAQAVSGQTAATILGNIATATAKYRAAQRTIYWVWAGPNDLVAGTPGGTIAATLYSICDACRATGPNARVVLSYIMNGGVFDGVSGYTAAQEAERVVANNDIALNGAAHADVLTDPRGVVPGAYALPNWVNNIHPSFTGMGFLVPNYEAAFAAVSG